MRMNEVRELRGATPFKPFVIHLADGRTVPVHHRDFVMSAPNERTMIVYQPDSSFAVIDVMLVTGLRVKSSNGRPPHKR